MVEPQPQAAYRHSRNAPTSFVLPTLGGKRFSALSTGEEAPLPDAANSPKADAAPPINPIRVSKKERKKMNVLPIAAAEAVEARRALRRRRASKGDAVASASSSSAFQKRASFGLNLEGPIPSPRDATATAATPPSMAMQAKPPAEAAPGGPSSSFKGRRALGVGRADAAKSRGTQEVEQVLQRCGVTAAELSAVGFSAAEGVRLQNALFVYSQGLRQLFAELFGASPERVELLQKVWAGFASLLEATAEEGGVLQEGSPLQAMLRQRSEHARLMAEAQAEAASKLDAAMRLAEVKLAAAANAAASAARSESLERLVEVKAQLEAAAAEAASAAAECKEARRERDAEARARSEAEARVAGLEAQLRPLRAEQAQLRELKGLVPQLRAGADRLQVELTASREKRQSLEAELRLAAMGVELWRGEVAPSDEALARAELTVRELQLSVGVTERRLEIEKGQVERLQAAAAAHRDEIKAARAELHAQLDDAAAELEAARQERNDAELRRVDADNKAAAAHAEIGQREEVIEAKQRTIRELHGQLQRKEDERGRAEQLEAKERAKAARSREAELKAIDEARDSQRQLSQLLDGQQRLRDEAARKATQVEQLERDMWKRDEELKAEVHKAKMGAATATSQQAEQEGLLRAAEAALARKTAEAETIVRSRAAVEEEHAARLTKERHLRLLQKFEYCLKAAKFESRAADDAKQLAATREQFAELARHFDALQADVAALTTHNECLCVELNEWREALAAVRDLSVTRDALGGVPAELDALSAAADDQLAFQIEQQRVIDASGAALDAALADAALAAERAAQLAPMAARALEAEAELLELKPRLAHSQVEAVEARRQLLQLEAEAARARERHAAAMSGQAEELRVELARVDAARDDAERRASETLEALGEAEAELAEWRVGNVRVATYQKWKEARASGNAMPRPAALQRVATKAANLAFDKLVPDASPSPSPSVLNLSLGAVAES